MAKLCLLCGKKLNMMNSVTIDGFTFCLDCRDKIDLLKNSEDIQTLNERLEKLTEKTLRGSSEYNYIISLTDAVRDRLSGEKISAEEAEKKEKERIEREEQQRQERLVREREEQQRQERLRAEAAERNKKLHEDRLNSLRYRGYEGYYEYKTVIINDGTLGGVSSYEITSTLNDLALDGWRLVSSYANELGHNSTPGSFGSSGTNSTIDEHIFILERYIKL